MNVTIVRTAYLPTATLGWLVADRLRLATLEEAWKADPDGPGGQRREGTLIESCIPDGTYQLKPHFSQNYREGVWALANPIHGVYAPGTRPVGQTWGRDAVLIHSGNHTDHTQGCILVGLRHEIDGGRYVVRESRAALQKLRELLGGKLEHRLLIRPCSGTSEIAA
jgi:hypothetical protein